MGDWLKKVKGLSKTNKLIDADNSTVITRGIKRVRKLEEGKAGGKW